MYIYRKLSYYFSRKNTNHENWIKMMVNKWLWVKSLQLKELRSCSNIEMMYLQMMFSQLIQTWVSDDFIIAFLSIWEITQTEDWHIAELFDVPLGFSWRDMACLKGVFISKSEWFVCDSLLIRRYNCFCWLIDMAGRSVKGRFLVRREIHLAKRVRWMATDCGSLINCVADMHKSLFE